MIVELDTAQLKHLALVAAARGDAKLEDMADTALRLTAAVHREWLRSDEYRQSSEYQADAKLFREVHRATQVERERAWVEEQEKRIPARAAAIESSGIGAWAQVILEGKSENDK